METIAAKLEDPTETRKVLKARVKLDGYHQTWLKLRQRIAQYEAPPAVLKDKSLKMESKKKEIDQLTTEYWACHILIQNLKI